MIYGSDLRKLLPAGAVALNAWKSDRPGIGELAGLLSRAERHRHANFVPSRNSPAGPAAQAGVSGFSVRNAASGAPEMMIYDEIGYWGVSAQDVVDALREIGNASDITVRINSYGGEVFDGVAIYNALVSHPASIAVQVDGIAASAASVIAMAGDSVTMQPGSTMMIHDAWGGCMGNAADMRATAEILDLLSENIAGIYAARAGGTQAEWRGRMATNGGDGTWYGAAEAVAAGLADATEEPDEGAQDAPPSDRWRQELLARRLGLDGTVPAPVLNDFDLVGALRAAFNK